jgi:eukaryotic-like serine/threonine-protein kinase
MGWRPSRRGPVLLAVVLVLTLLAAGFGWYFGVGRYTTTPGVIDLSQQVAQKRIEAAGLSFKVADQQYSETVTKGAVISTDPSAGDRVLKDGTVSAVISLGPERHGVPHLAGLTVDQAADALASQHLDVGRITKVYSDTVDAGVVIKSNPHFKTLLPRDTAVGLTVSKGPKPIVIKDYTGKSASAVTAHLTELGLKVTQDDQYDDHVPEGKIVSQDPQPGETLHKDDTINLVVSKGPPLVEVPGVRGHGRDSAVSELEHLGFVVDVKKSDNYLGLGYVFSQDPPSGTMLARGSTITLYLI